MIYRRLTVLVLSIMMAFPLFGEGSEKVMKECLERIDSGLSEKIEICIDPADGISDYYRIAQHCGRPRIVANNLISAAVGVNRYLRDFAGVCVGWNSMCREMSDSLPSVTRPVFARSAVPLRYYLNYCTHSYSMAFWDWARWEREIDWMAFHGINMPLVVAGSAALWRNVLLRLGYDEDGIGRFVAGPGFQAWWLMNNLESWGGPNDRAFYDRDLHLARQIVGRMKEFGMEPVVPGYSGMVPHDAATKLGLSVKDPGLWCGFTRPAFLQPEDKDFDRIADIYYDEARKIYGDDVRYYSMDPFHEGGRTEGVDMHRAGRKILEAVKRHHPDGRWVVQSWQENPRSDMIDSLPAGDLVILDLQSEHVPGWIRRPEGYGGHDWIFCMLHNFGGNVGLYGKMQALIDNYYDKAAGERGLRGVGLTMEGIENNPVVYDLLCDMPWQERKIDLQRWVSDYVAARYGGHDAAADSAWRLLVRSVYDCPADSVQQGTHESVFCARPSDNPRQVSTWSSPTDYYDGDDVVRAAQLLAGASEKFAGNTNFRYDLVDVTRQAVAERGRMVSLRISEAVRRNDKEAYRTESQRFLRLIDLQDSLLGTISGFRLGRWLEMARSCASSPEQQARWEWNARVQISTWGPRPASDAGGLHDYAHREWQGLLSGLYKERWRRWFDARIAAWGGPMPEIDFYEMEEMWANSRDVFSAEPEGDPVAVAIETLRVIESPDFR